MADQHFAFRHKVGAIAHQADTFEFGINGVAQFAGECLLEESDIQRLQSWFEFEQNFGRASINSCAVPGMPCSILVMSGKP